MAERKVPEIDPTAPPGPVREAASIYCDQFRARIPGLVLEDWEEEALASLLRKFTNGDL